MPQEPETGPFVTLVPSGERRSFPPGTPLTDALFDMGVVVKTPCGGKGTCGKCGMRIDGEPGEALACRTAVTRDITVHAGRANTVPVLDVPEFGLARRLAAAVDIGTTSVRVALADLDENTSSEVSSFLNPQRRFGHDVITRIAAARDPAVNTTLTGLIRRAVRGTLDSVLAAAGRTAGSLESMVFSGNTTMLYLLLGLDVQPLGRHPYHAATRDFASLPPTAAGLTEDSATRTSALPVVGAFIGADLVGGLALCHARRKLNSVFFIDLGTNGEIFVADRTGRVFATSCAMGPALEGMNISWGMTADDGAVTHIRQAPGGLVCDVLGSGDPAGITGTALIDLLAILLDRGLVSATGAFSRDIDAMDLPEPLEPAREDGALSLNLWGRIRLTQKDIRNVQLAKAAALAASRLLLSAAGTPPEDIRHVFIAGALGEHMDMEHFRRLGFIPAFPNASFEYVGNTSLQAAVEACLDPCFIGHAATLRDRVQEVLLSGQEDFQDMFIRSIDFPGA